jgi:protein TonB
MVNSHYPQTQALATRRLIAISGVVLLHVLVLYALITGLARDVVKVLQNKVEVAVISEPPPPPPPPPPPKVIKVAEQIAPSVAPPAYVPPVLNPPRASAENAIVAVSSDAPKDTPPSAPAAPVQEAPKGPVSVFGNCSNIGRPDYPEQALADEIQGVIKVRFGVGAGGKPDGIASINFSGDIPPGYRGQFRAAISKALQSYSCKTNLGDTLLEQEFAFKLD